MSRRFNLDPRAPSRASPPPPAPKPPGPSSAPPAGGSAPRFSAPPSSSPPTTSPTPPTPTTQASLPQPTRDRKKAYLIAGVIAAILLVGGAVAIYAATELGYPNKYLLDNDEMPSGMSNARMSQGELSDAGMSKNPGRVDEEQFRDDLPTESDPDEIHAQVLSDSRGARILIFAMQFPEEGEARSAATEARAICSFLNGAALRDGDVLVLVMPEGASPSSVGSVVRALKAKTPDLEQVCGPR